MRDLLIWCSSHTPTDVQLQELNNMGEVHMLKDIDSNLLQKLGDSPIDECELTELAQELLLLSTLSFEMRLDKQLVLVQPAGSPAFQAVLGVQLKGSQTVLLYAHSERVSIDEPQADGSVKKVSTFKHRGWTRI